MTDPTRPDDPFEHLGDPVDVDPARPAFVARLRARLELELAVDAPAASAASPAPAAPAVPAAEDVGTSSDPAAPTIRLTPRRSTMSQRPSPGPSPSGSAESDPTGGPGGVDPGGRRGDNGRIWAAVNAADAPAMIRFMVDVLGFTEQLVVPGEHPDVVEHSQLRWPEGGVVQVSSADRPGNVFSHGPTGAQNLYVVTDDPSAVHRRCVEAGVELVRELAATDYDPGGSVFAIRDHEGNLWSFGTYAGE